MKTVLFCIPLKTGCLKQYLDFAHESVKRPKEYKEMMDRYDIHCVKIWHKNIEGRDHIFVYHEVGPHFAEKMKSWDSSQHPFDKWFRESIMAVYDIQDASGMEQPSSVIEFK